ncbi:MAG: DUF1003 domain-containing protein [Pirellulales bacterium]
MDETQLAQCQICGRTLPRNQVIPAATVRTPVVDEIRTAHGRWDNEGFICTADLDRFRFAHVENVLRSEQGELTTLDEEVLRSLHQHEIVSEDVDTQFDQHLALGERMADHIASFGGSWPFIVMFGIVLAIWILANSVGAADHFDPFPYILLNLVLSCLAAIQAPVIMMSQNRQESKDRLRSQHDYKVNLKAELEIRQLHEKVDHLLRHQWERLVEIQQIQIDLLEELRDRRPEKE